MSEEPVVACRQCQHPEEKGVHSCAPRMAVPWPPSPAGLGGTVERECHGCVERDHEIERLRRVVDAVCDGMDDRLDALTRRVARMLAQPPRVTRPMMLTYGPPEVWSKVESDAEYAERLYREAVSPEAVRE